MLLINYFELVVRGGVVHRKAGRRRRRLYNVAGVGRRLYNLRMSRRRRVGRVRRRTPETILLSLKRRRERAERRPPNIREACIRMAAPELRLAPVLGREGRRRHAVEEARRASREVVAVPP